MQKFNTANWLKIITGIAVLYSCPSFMVRADNQGNNQSTIIAVAACDSFAEIRQQFAWVGNLIGIPVLGGLPDTYAMMTTGGKGLQGLDINRPIGVVVSAQGDTPIIHGFLPATDAQSLIETFADIPFRSMIEMTNAEEWVLVTPQGQPATINDPQDMLSSITSHLSVGVKLFPSQLPETLKESLLDSAEQGLGVINSTENPAQAKFLDGLPVQGFDKDVASDTLAQLEAVLFGFSVDKENDRIFLESRTIFSERSTAGGFWATAGEVEPSLSLPSAVGPYAIKLQVAQHLDDITQLKDMEEGLLTGLGQIKQAQLGELARKVSTVLLPQISKYEALELVAGLAPPKNLEGEQPLPSVVLGMGIADGYAMAEQLKTVFKEEDSIPENITIEFDVAEADGFSFHDIVMMPLGKVTLAIGENCLYAMTQAADESEYKAVSREPVESFRPIAAVNVRLESLLGGVAELSPEMAMVSENLKPQGELDLLVRPITRGLAVRLSADGEAVQTGAALGTKVSALKPTNAVIGE